MFIKRTLPPSSFDGRFVGETDDHAARRKPSAPDTGYIHKIDAAAIVSSTRGRIIAFLIVMDLQSRASDAGIVASTA